MKNKVEFEAYAGEISIIPHEDYIEFNSPIRLIPTEWCMEKEKAAQLFKVLDARLLKVTIERVK